MAFRPFYTIDNLPESVFEDRKSQFFGFLAHVHNEQEAVAFRKSIKERIPEASHYVSAYVFHEPAFEHYSDAKEPHGTAGLPVLNVLKGHKLEDVVCVVARIFGGTLLGKGGLMRAYTKAAQLAVEQAEIVQVLPCRDLRITVDYSLYELLKAMLESKELHLLDTAFTDKVTLTLRVESSSAPKLQDEICDFTQGKAAIELGEEYLSTLHTVRK